MCCADDLIWIDAMPDSENDANVIIYVHTGAFSVDNGAGPPLMLAASIAQVWIVYARRDRIVASKNPGPWCLAVPPAGKDHWHWVPLTNDDDFIVEHVTKSE